MCIDACDFYTDMYRCLMLMYWCTGCLKWSCIDAYCVCIDAQVVSSGHVSMQNSCVSMHRVFALPCIDAWLVCIDAYWTEIVLWLITCYMYRCRGSCIDTYWHKMHFNCYLKGIFNVDLYVCLCNNKVGWWTK